MSSLGNAASVNPSPERDPNEISGSSFDRSAPEIRDNFRAELARKKPANENDTEEFVRPEDDLSGPQREDGRPYIIGIHRRLAPQAPSRAEIMDMQGEIETIVRGHKLDFFPQIFEIVNYEQLAAIVARTGLPVRYPHWSFGMEYVRNKRPYDLGLSKVSELVINTNPCYAFLVDSNAAFEQRTVMAHVYGHNNFFVRNLAFADSDRKAHNTMANHRSRIQEIIGRIGYDEVEKFIDTVRSIDDLIDPTIVGRRKQYEDYLKRPPEILNPANTPRARRFSTPEPYMDSFINPAEQLKAEDEKLRKEYEAQQERFPRERQRDVMLFVLEHGQLKDWQRDILSMLREEAYYFAPQAQTKIMNEGWASYWHYKLMTEHLLPKYQGETTDFGEFHGAVLAESARRLNPYRLGFKLFQDIEERWNKGRFGPEYEECTNWKQKENWDRNLGLGQEKIRQVRDVYTDYTFVDTFLTPEFVRKERMFLQQEIDGGLRQVTSTEFAAIKEKILVSLTNRGQPILEVIDGNYKNRGELVLEHQFDGRDLDVPKAKATLENLFKLWGRPVHVRTVLDSRSKLLTFDGRSHDVNSI